MPAGLITIAEAAEEYGVHSSTVRRWIDRGLLPAFRVGERRIGLKRTDLERMVRRLASQADDSEAAAIERIKRRRLTKEERERGLKALEDMRRLSKELAAEYGVSETPSWVIINQEREKRTRQLLGEDDGE